MTFNRSKIRGAKVSSITEARKDAEKHSRFFSKGYTGFHKIESGMNQFRIAPPHSPEGTPFVPIRSTWLQVETEILDDDRNPTGKKELRNRRIFIATVHGGLKEDPIEVYIEYVRKRANDEFDSKEDRQRFLSPITGWRSKEGKWNPGINPSTNYIAYAWDRDWNLGRLEVYPRDINEIERLNIDEDTGEPIEVDIFSDPDTGRWLNINLFKNDKGKNERILSKREFQPKQGMRAQDLAQAWEEFEESCRVPDDKLKEWFEKDSLEEIYVGVYTQRDFQLAIDGLSRFDSKHGFGIFENSEFIDKLEEISELVPEFTPDENEEEEKPKKVKELKRKSPKVVYEEPEEEEEIDEDPVPVVEKTTKRSKTVLEKIDEEEEFEEPEVSASLKKDRAVDTTPNVDIPSDVQDRIAALRNRIKGN